MTLWQSSPRLLACLLVALGLSWSSQAWAQDDGEMTFEEEDTQGDMIFGPQGAKDAPSENGGTPTVAVVLIPDRFLAGATRLPLQAELRAGMNAIPGYVVYGDSEVLPLLEERIALECARESLCLASVGRQAGVDRILVGIVVESAEGYRLELSLFNVQERLFERYNTQSGLPALVGVQTSMRPALAEMFGMRQRVAETFHEDSSGNIRRILGWTTGGLAFASLGAGAYFGNQAKAKEEELLAMPKSAGGRYTTLTQREAQNRAQDLDSAAVTANIFYGLSVGLGLTSALLFFVQTDTVDGDEAYQYGVAPRPKGLALTPVLGPREAGVAARLAF